MAVHKISAYESDLLLLTDTDLAALAQGKTIRVGAVQIKRLPSAYLYGADIAARLDEHEWNQRPDLW